MNEILNDLRRVQEDLGYVLRDLDYIESVDAAKDAERFVEDAIDAVNSAIDVLDAELGKRR